MGLLQQEDFQIKIKPAYVDQSTDKRIYFSHGDYYVEPNEEFGINVANNSDHLFAVRVTIDHALDQTSNLYIEPHQSVFIQSFEYDGKLYGFMLPMPVKLSRRSERAIAIDVKLSKVIDDKTYFDYMDDMPYSVTDIIHSDDITFETAEGIPGEMVDDDSTIRGRLKLYQVGFWVKRRDAKY